MGDPRKIRAKYSKPLHPWERFRIEDERILKRDYGLKNKKEIWKFISRVRKINSQVKKIVSRRTEQSAVEEKQLLDKLYTMGITEKDSKLDDVLGLDIKRILDRRLESVVYKQKLSNSIKQARQFIIHGHIKVGEKKVTIPSYIVLRGEENKINYVDGSSLSNAEHPERKIIGKERKKEEIKKESAVVKGYEGLPPENEGEFKEKEAEAKEILKQMQDKLISEKNEK